MVGYLFWAIDCGLIIVNYSDFSINFQATDKHTGWLLKVCPLRIYDGDGVGQEGFG